MLCAGAKDAGAGSVVAVGGRQGRRELASAFGAIPGDGAGADVVIEAVGSEEAWRDAVRLARPGGTVVLFGGLRAGAEVLFDAHRVHYEELSVRGAFHHAPRHIRAALAFLASGAYPWERLVTHQVGLEEVAGLFADPPPDLLKAAVLP
jgi:L-iditol 2-dehydrogenase